MRYQVRFFQFPSLHFKIQHHFSLLQNSISHLFISHLTTILQPPFRMSASTTTSTSHQTSTQNPQILILGAGITALSTTLALLTSPSTSHFTITLIAAHLPGDLSPEYTSPWAGGDWHSHVSTSDEDADVRKWDGRTYQAWMEMLSNYSSGDASTSASASLQRKVGGDQTHNSEISTGKGDREQTEQKLGLHPTTLRYFWGSHNSRTHPSGSGIWFSSMVQDFHILDADLERREGRPVPREAVFGTRFRTVTFDPVVHLEYLLRRVRALGARVVRGVVDTGRGLEGVVESMRRLVKREDGEGDIGEDNVFAVVNCAGLSARHFLPSQEAEKLFPIRGQTVVVKGQAKEAYTYVSIPSAPEDELLYVIPRPGDMTVLGGCKQVGSWDKEVDLEMGERIMERVKRGGLAEELRIGEDGGFEVVRQQVGFRPGRKGGPRVEVEREKVGGVWVVHSYGHGSGGFQASVGCAERIVELVEGLM
ncbi:hypothetical protein ONS95_000231 [Cadophora gregata]|uniref:uncharacterized protein n=1 Tax=Cadophora gregata TaxID=51156 RepID=UPI0026DAEEE4|nr:uncharacterized protein ONS95_000231 [Cadophora gregata]KAK0099500.1 hypothetical protein ONS96_008337 [Cadophora gregata f. sp. sojae]KAK0128255.1 hypothetical protein ONS95_000231 [Cadophora gregata]